MRSRKSCQVYASSGSRFPALPALQSGNRYLGLAGAGASTRRSPSSTTARSGRPVFRAWRFARTSRASWMSRVVFMCASLPISRNMARPGNSRLQVRRTGRKTLVPAVCTSAAFALQAEETPPRANAGNPKGGTRHVTRENHRRGRPRAGAARPVEGQSGGQVQGPGAGSVRRRGRLGVPEDRRADLARDSRHGDRVRVRQAGRGRVLQGVSLHGRSQGRLRPARARQTTRRRRHRRRGPVPHDRSAMGGGSHRPRPLVGVQPGVQ